LLAGADIRGWAAATATMRDDLDRMLRAHASSPDDSQANWLLMHAPGLRDRLAPQARPHPRLHQLRHARRGPASPCLPDGLERLDAALSKTRLTHAT